MLEKQNVPPGQHRRDRVVRIRARAKAFFEVVRRAELRGARELSGPARRPQWLGLLNQFRSRQTGILPGAAAVATDLQQTVAAFERALALEPANWSLYLDLADVRAEQGDFTSAVRLIDEGMRYEPTELSLRAAGAAYRARLTGSRADLSELIELAPNLPNDSYRDLLIDHACAGPALPAELVAAARRIQHN
ncbi:tetratricopeptide repeat protein [Streptomyces gilvifuscus]|uniref:tetratricopeptide repeat protein n=1 Tax=Streptomyces gilvifuscus TaxID=1550617 RepID=UPI002FEE33B8